VRIGEIVPDGPAEAAGLKVGDILFSLDGNKVTGADDLIALLGASRIGRDVELAVLRAGRIERVTVRPIEATATRQPQKSRN
jgi:S1-C subfamily serine protease